MSKDLFDNLRPIQHEEAVKRGVTAGNLIYYPELAFCAVVMKSDPHVTRFSVYTVVQENEDGSLYVGNDVADYGDINADNYYFDGSVKWTGAANWNMNPLDNCIYFANALEMREKQQKLTVLYENLYALAAASQFGD